MKSSITHIPSGMADLLCGECERKTQIEDAARGVFQARGYHRVQTPTFEYCDVYQAAATTADENMFKFFDSNGRMLALRPDITTSIARLVATKCQNDPLPIKLSYSGSAFRNDEAFSRSRQREFSQVGVEYIGEAGASADAEIIEVAIETLKNAGVKEFQIDLGQAEFFKGLARQANLSEEDADELRRMIDSKDFIEMEAVIDRYGLSGDLRELFLNLPTMFGDISIAAAALDNPAVGERSKAALKNLIEIYEILRARGLEQYISIDLSMVPNLNYYTGMILKGFTYGIPFPICAGGRYDNLTAKFGRELPATGVAIAVERVMDAIGAKPQEEEAARSSEYITVALAKGRLAELSIDIFQRMGYDCAEVKSKTTRKLIFTDEKNKTKFILVKASDVPTYVEYGAADIGIVGKDTLLESNKNLYEVLDLGFGACKMAVAGPPSARESLKGSNIMRVASKYPNIAREYFHKVKGQTVEIIKLNGSVELGPLVGLSDVIVDIVESGKTLQENGLEVLEDICRLSARLVVNRVSMKLQKDRILEIMDKMKGELA